MTTTETKTCTVRHTTGLCGRPAVYTFTTATGETFHECGIHYAGEYGKTYRPEEARVGAEVEIRRYGKTYIGKVVEVGARGAVYAEFTYAKGTKRRVRV